MGFNEDELLKIKKATSGLFKKKARKAISSSILALKPKIDAVKTHDEQKRKEEFTKLLEEATSARHLALQMGANGFSNPQWAAAAACESWLLELLRGTPESIARVEKIIVQMSNRV